MSVHGRHLNACRCLAGRLGPRPRPPSRSAFPYVDLRPWREAKLSAPRTSCRSPLARSFTSAAADADAAAGAASAAFRAKSPSPTSSVSRSEVEKFSAMNEGWWDATRNPLMAMNKTRMAYIRHHVARRLLADPSMAGDSSLEGSTTLASGQPHPPKQLLPTNEPLKILDVGCGGGLACESLARIFQTAHRVTRDEGHTGAGGSSDRTDAEVTKHDVDDSGDTVVVVGIDPSPDLLEVARSHALLDPLRTGCIQYHNMSVEEYAEKFWNQQEQRHQQQGEEMNEEKHQHKDGGARVLDGPFDAICLLEVVEHVEDAALLDSMLTSLAGLLKEGGLLFVSTLNRTWKSHLLTIVGAEYVMGYLPVGTHRFDLYKSPDEIRSILVRHGLRQLDAAGMVPTSVPIPLSPPSWLIPKTLAPITGPDAPPPPLLPLALLRSMLPSPSWEWKLDPRDTNVNWIGTYQKQSIAAFESE